MRISHMDPVELDRCRERVERRLFEIERDSLPPSIRLERRITRLETQFDRNRIVGADRRLDELAREVALLRSDVDRLAREVERRPMDRPPLKHQLKRANRRP